MTWQPETFEVATFYGPSAKAGYTYRGLGLHMEAKPSPKGKRAARWCLSHLGSGHRLCQIIGNVASAFPIASEIAEAGDWNFLSLEGWRDRFPDFRERLDEILVKYPKQTIRAKDQRPEDVAHSREVAMQIAANRP